MTTVGIIVGALVAFLVLKFVAGTVKWLVLGALVLFALYMAGVLG